MILRVNADWLFELTSFTKKYNNTIPHIIKMTPIEACLKKSEKVVFDNLQDKRVKQERKSKLGQLVRTADIERVFSSAGSTHWSK